MSEGKIIEGRFPQHSGDNDEHPKGEAARLFKIGPKGREADPQDSVFTQEEIDGARQLDTLRHAINEVYTALGGVDLNTRRATSALLKQYQAEINEGRKTHEDFATELFTSREKDWHQNKARYLALTALLEDYLSGQ
jgi:hypothetical protein